MVDISIKHPKIDDFHNGIKPMPKLFRVVSVDLMFCVAALVVAMASYLIVMPP
ncbi:hypothetical protein [Providencia sp. PROV255]|uniref:hypothetical protein n=1 Tax=Providencia sp. PROV255 TaxID=2949943 RepID=UPI002349A4AD|nr:hypothetical protein [Providencia sp. PROV255]